MSDEIPADIAIETVYMVEATYTPEAAERRPAVRPSTSPTSGSSATPG